MGFFPAPACHRPRSARCGWGGRWLLNPLKVNAMQTNHTPFDGTADAAFLGLLEAFATNHGLRYEPGDDVLAFEADALSVRILPDPRKTHRMLVQVDCTYLPEQLSIDVQSELLLLLHHLNSAARFEHEWVISIDPARTIRMHRPCDIAQTSVADLEALMEQAIEQGLALQQVVTGMSAMASASATPPDLSPLQRSGMIRV